jgi:Cu/Ag efflux pump CusA
MASTFVSGLAVATILTLFIVPVLWDMIMEREEKERIGFIKYWKGRFSVLFPKNR